ncbi:hypothetical protein ACFW9I_36145 [[Kitasatospora] papulosa]|uniref:hypothetical protein n=1 Tax=[Kitasatospora] papulosa TaxID=1464011 RepID=UPI00368A9B4E
MPPKKALTEDQVILLLRQYISDYKRSPDNPPAWKNFNGEGTGLTVGATWISDSISGKCQSSAFNKLDDEEKLFFAAQVELRTRSSAKQPHHSAIQEKIVEWKGQNQVNDVLERLKNKQDGKAAVVKERKNMRDRSATSKNVSASPALDVSAQAHLALPAGQRLLSPSFSSTSGGSSHVNLGLQNRPTGREPSATPAAVYASASSTAVAASLTATDTLPRLTRESEDKLLGYLKTSVMGQSSNRARR